VVSADSGAPDETNDVGAVDWLSGATLLDGLRTLDGREGTSDMALLGEVVVRWSSLACLKWSVRTVGRELSLGRRTTVSLFISALEILAVSCWERLGVDQLVVMGVGGGVRVLGIGSDSPSKTAAFVSWSNDEESGSRERAGRVIGTSGTTGHCRGELE